MKGITTVIAILLLLLITLSVTGITAIFINRLTDMAGQSAQNEASSQIIKISKQVIIDSWSSSSVSIRSIGSGRIASSELAVYVNYKMVTCSPQLSDFTPNTMQTCNFSPACLQGQPIKVTSPATSVEIHC
ncbi:MAG TPA: hypothetical protein HA230_04550 [Candidatus Aenigmarchaeota archaeon]|nr:hypothetical protein [Candidatus Aenigmarchaeota archaeon]